MKNEITIDGARYVRATKTMNIDGELYVLMEADPDQMLTVAEIHEMTGKSVHAINDAMNDGRLPYSVPNGCKRPRRARRSDVTGWLRGGDAAGATAK
jgi:predicted DNA-binding transcriptional regulator AlpA